VIAGIAAAAIIAARQVYFLGTDEGGRLALYRGLPYDLPLGIELYDEVLSSPTLVQSLPQDRRDEATNHDLRSHDDAVDLLENLEDASVTTPTDTGPQPEAQQDESQPGRQGGKRRQGAGGAQARNGG
jgi:hypothetical protein